MAAFHINPAEDVKGLVNGTSFPATTGGIHVEVAGLLDIVTVGGTTLIMEAEQGYHPIQIVSLGGGTTATGVKGLYATAQHAR